MGVDLAKMVIAKELAFNSNCLNIKEGAVEKYLKYALGAIPGIGPVASAAVVLGEYIWRDYQIAIAQEIELEIRTRFPVNQEGKFVLDPEGVYFREARISGTSGDIITVNTAASLQSTTGTDGKEDLLYSTVNVDRTPDNIENVRLVNVPGAGDNSAQKLGASLSNANLTNPTELVGNELDNVLGGNNADNMITGLTAPT